MSDATEAVRPSDLLLPVRLDEVPLADLFVAAADLITEARRRGLPDPSIPTPALSASDILEVADAVTSGLLAEGELERLFRAHPLDQLGTVVREAARRAELGRGLTGSPAPEVTQ